MSAKLGPSTTRCPFCGGDCRAWGLETCPLRPRQIPRTTTKEPLFMSNPALQLRCTNNHPMDRGADWCSTCGEPRKKPDRAQDSSGRMIGVGDRVSWRGQIFTIKAFGDRVGRCETRAIEFEEPLHVEGEIPDEIGVDLVRAAAHNVCRSCGGDCPRWGTDACLIPSRGEEKE
jgi:hypothetical protein